MAFPDDESEFLDPELAKRSQLAATDEAPAVAPAAPNPNQGKSWNDWIDSAYGTSKSRGGGFADANGTSLQDAITRYNTETGGSAKYIGGPSGDLADFGNGTQDALTAGGQFWLDPNVRNGKGGGGDPTRTVSDNGNMVNNTMPYAPPPPSSPFDFGPDVAGPGAFVPQERAGDIQGPGAYQPTQGRGVNRAAGSAQTAVDQAGRQGILDQMARSQQPVSAQDPVIKAQQDQYASTRNRAATQQRAAMAERAAASGLNSGGSGSGSFNTGLNSIYGTAGRDIAGNEAGLLGTETAARRADLQHSLDLATSVGARDEAQQIQMELADLDQGFRYDDMNQRGNQANQDLNFRTGQQNQQNKLGFASLEQSGRATNEDQRQRAAITNQMNRFNQGQLKQQGDLTREQIGAENWRFGQGDATNRMLGQGNLDLGNRRLGQDTSQWNDQYGLDRERFGADLDRDAMLRALMGGA